VSAAAAVVGDVRGHERQQHSTGSLPLRTGSEPNVPSRFWPIMNGQHLLLSPLSRATAWPQSRIGRREPGMRYRSQHVFN
jgi:hypothetical protein